jgi:hypothetical protein
MGISGGLFGGDYLKGVQMLNFPRGYSEGNWSGLWDDRCKNKRRPFGRLIIRVFEKI